MATAFGSGTCSIPNFPLNSCHFYDMDNETDIWGGTHIDIHPNPSGYDELANVYVTQAQKSERMGSGGRSAWSRELLLVVLLERREQQ